MSRRSYIVIWICKALKDAPGGQLLGKLFGGKQSQTQSELYPKFSLEKGIGFKRLEDGIDIRVDVDGDGREDIAYKLVPVGYNEEEGLYLMAPLEVYIDKNKNEKYTEDEHFKTTLAGDN